MLSDVRGIDFDSPNGAAYILIFCVMLFLVWIMWTTVDSDDPPPVDTIPPSVYVVETTP